MRQKCIFILSIICIIHFCCGQLLGSDISKINAGINKSFQIEGTHNSVKVVDWEPTTSMYLELLGKGFYSINLDFRKSEKKAFSIGVQFAEGDFIPSLMYYQFSGARYRFEKGAGLSGIISADDGLEGMMIHGVIGYRYQKKNGLLFRGGFTPFIGIPFTNDGKFVIVPFPGVSLGYSF